MPGPNLFFIRALPGVGTTRDVGASATAEFVTAVQGSPRQGVGAYSKDGPVNLSMYGPEYQWGDPHSTRWIDNTGTLNPDHLNFNGYNNGSRSPDGKTEWDEIRDPYNGPGQQPTSIYTKTEFSLYKVNDPNDSSKDTPISTVDYHDDPATNNKWVTPPGFSINTSVYGTGKFRLNVKTVDGSSENGFDLRAGPPLKDGATFDKNNIANNITATDAIPINFNTSGLTTIQLGAVPSDAAGQDLTIAKFDTDVQAQNTVVYKSIPPASNQPLGGWPGRLTGNAEWVTDDPIELPADYKAATWYATYRAGFQDTSLWKMSYDAVVPGKPGRVHLVGRNNKPY